MPIGIRDYLKSRGYNDEDITYDNGVVKLKGRSYMAADPSADSKTYADQNQLMRADNSYEMGTALDQYRQNLNKPRAQFTYDAASDPAYQNAMQQAQRGAQTAANNTQATLRARGQGRSSYSETVANQIQQRAVADVNSNTLPQLIAQAYTRFRDSQAMDEQQNQNLLRLADFYNGQNQQAFSNDLATKQQEMQGKQANWGAYMQSVGLTGNLGTGPKTDWSMLGGTDGAQTVDYQKFLQDKAAQEAALLGSYNGQDTMAKKSQAYQQWLDNQQLDISRQNAATSAANAAASRTASESNASFNRKMDIWKATGKAPAGIEGVPEGTPYSSVTGAASNDRELQGLYEGLSSGKLNPLDASREVDLQLKNKLITPEQAAQMKQLIQGYAETTQPVTKETGYKYQTSPNESLPALSMEELAKQWETDPTGKAAGRPLYDWRDWIMDPNGYAAGTSYELWHSKYGPSLGGRK